MVGLLLAALYVLLAWLVSSAPVSAIILTGLNFLFKWYVLWAALGGIYGVYSIFVATAKNSNKGCLATIGTFLLATVLVVMGGFIHYGALLWGTTLLIGLVASFNWLILGGAILLLCIGFLMQVIELLVILA